MAIRNLINVSANTIPLTDFNGVNVASGETINGLMFGEDILRNSESVHAALLVGDLKLNDGFIDYLGQSAVDLLRGYAAQLTKDGKPIYTSSDRPKDYYRCFSGKSDDIVGNHIGTGTELRLVVNPGATASVDCKFVDTVYIRDGFVSYLDAGFDSHLTVDVICPANTPFPSPTHTGTLDLVGTQWVANTTATGAYMTAPVEVTLFRFINTMPLVGGEGKVDMQSPEPFTLNYPYFLRFILTSDTNNSTPVRAAVCVGMFRKKTL